MSNAVYINDRTREALDALSGNLPQGMLLFGKKGVGLKSAAEYFLKDLKASKLYISPENGSISVEEVRKLYDITKTRGEMKVLVIEDADKMTVSAQNAFLKLLEEPNSYTKFILLTHNKESLLPTVLSRVNSTEILTITAKMSEQLLDDLKIIDPTRRSQMLFMASGLSQELRQLHDEKYFNERVEIVKDARTYVSGSSYDRSLIAHKYKDGRDSAKLLLEDCMKIVKMTSENKHDTTLMSVLDRLMAAYDAINYNGNIRTQLAVAL